MTETLARIEVAGGGGVTALRTGPADATWMLVYAPGAGSNLHDPFGAYAAQALADRGLACLRFQFPYQEARRRAPDRPQVLEATWRAALAHARAPAQRIVAGGRSMGGRIASQVAAVGEPLDALALFAYPLHAPGRPGQLRDAHLASIKAPVLFCSGDRDTFASPEELAAAASLVPRSRVHLLHGADHGFSVLRSSGRTREDVWAEAVAALLAFIEELS